MGLTRDLGRASVAATLFCASIATAQSSALADPACAAAHFLVGEWEVTQGDGTPVSNKAAERETRPRRFSAYPIAVEPPPLVRAQQQEQIASAS